MPDDCGRSPYRNPLVTARNPPTFRPRGERGSEQKRADLCNTLEREREKEKERKRERERTRVLAGRLLPAVSIITVTSLVLSTWRFQFSLKTRRIKSCARLRSNVPGHTCARCRAKLDDYQGNEWSLEDLWKLFERVTRGIVYRRLWIFRILDELNKGTWRNAKISEWNERTR